MIKRLFASESALIKGLRQGGVAEDQAIKKLLSKHRDMIFRLVTQKQGSEEDAADVLYESLTTLVLHVREGKFREESSLSTYWYAIAKGVWYKRLRKRIREENLEDQLAFEEDEVIDPEKALEDQEARFKVQALLGRLRPKCREVLLLWGQHYSMDEIAQKVGFKTAQNAMNKKSKCLSELKGLLKQEPELRGQLRLLFQA
ncbi:MAG: RNA polymerase sigma factor [Salibacteraceae bacterium]